MSMPKANIEWSKLPASACIEDRRTHYIAHLRGGKRAVVFWGSRDAKEAQASLWARSRSSANVRCMREINVENAPLPGLRGARRRRRRQ